MWQGALAGWLNGGCWQQYKTGPESSPRRIRAVFSTSSLRSSATTVNMASGCWVRRSLANPGELAYYVRFALSMLAQAYLSVIQHQGGATRRQGSCYGLDEDLTPLTGPEVRRLLTCLASTEHQLPEFILS